MIDWVHCNKCSLRINSTVQIFLTECGHLLCERCATNMKDAKCMICDKSTKTKLIAKDMDATIKPYFTPLETHLKKFMEVHNFQMQHITRLHQTFIQKYNYAKKECISVSAQNKKLVKENNMLRAMLMSIKRNNQQPFPTSTPFNNANMNLSDNMSAISSIYFTPRTGSAVRPGYAKKLPSCYDGNFRRPQFIPHPSSEGSSLSHVVPRVHKSAGSTFSMEQLNIRGGKRT